MERIFWVECRQCHGKFYCDYSTDGTTWTNFSSKAASNGLVGTIDIGVTDGNPGGAIVLFDNFEGG